MLIPLFIPLLSGLAAGQSIDLLGALTIDPQVLVQAMQSLQAAATAGLSSQVIPYDPTSAASSVFSSVAASGPTMPTSTGTSGSRQARVKRSIDSALSAASEAMNSDATERPGKRNAANGNCMRQPTGIAPMPTPDNASAFAGWHHYHVRARDHRSYQPPAGSSYVRTQVGYNASNVAIGYLGFHYLPLYRPNHCAQMCDNTTGCSAFNIYFERDPTVMPAPKCPNPPSSTTVKCALFGVELLPGTAFNVGQWREQFQVVIAGSNAYLRTDGCTNPPLPGYSQPVYFGNATIASKPDCNGQDAFLGYEVLNAGPFDYNLCAAACSATSTYLKGSSSGTRKQCTFFSTYVLNLNGIPVGQVCNLYSRYLDSSYATNYGGLEYGYPYTITQSYTSCNLTNPGKSNPDCPDQLTPALNNVCNGFIRPMALNMASLTAAALTAMPSQTGDYGYGY